MISAFYNIKNKIDIFSRQEKKTGTGTGTHISQVYHRSFYLGKRLQAFFYTGINIYFNKHVLQKSFFSHDTL